jgi:hypothetical protein
LAAALAPDVHALTLRPVAAQARGLNALVDPPERQLMRT